MTSFNGYSMYCAISILSEIEFSTKSSYFRTHVGDEEWSDSVECNGTIEKIKREKQKLLRRLSFKEKNKRSLFHLIGINVSNWVKVGVEKTWTKPA